ncbi:DNA replication licensing factor mcm8 [Mortierella alpina]|nr:DNA replication licensing factor mcm8 [Mortierella alpina]
MDPEEETLSIEVEETEHILVESSNRPPSGTNAPLLKSYTYTTPLPTALEPDQECILGVDEAGRGPVLGPMVYGICYCPLSKKDELADLGFADSKTLKEDERDNLLEVIMSRPDLIGWSVRVLSPMDISNSMLRREKYNLNALAHDTTIQLIRETLASGVNLKEVYVDTVGPPETYQKKLERLFPSITTIVVAKKADSKYPIVSAASICAKVTRDDVLRHWIFAESGMEETVSRQFGSGYPSDPKTVSWLKASMDPIFGYPNIVRFSWATCKSLLETSGKTVRWPDDDESNAQPRITALFSQSNEGSDDLDKQRKQYSMFASKNTLRPRPMLMQDMALRSVTNQRGKYTHRGANGDYMRGRGRGRGNGGAGGNNSQYPGRSQNPAKGGHGNRAKRWERPMTSATRNQDSLEFEEDIVNMPMVQADELPVQALHQHRTVPPRTRQVQDCPWLDWDVYLPLEDYHAEHECVQWISEFRRYIMAYHLHGISKEQQASLERRRVLVVNIKTMAQACAIQDLIEIVAHRPMIVTGCIALAAIQALYGDVAAKEIRQKRFTVRLACFERITHGKDLKANLIGKMICVRGTVVRTSGVKPLATKMAFTCNTCQSAQTLEFPDARFISPTKCHEKGCRGRQFTPQRGVGYDTETVDWQTIRLQEKLPDDRMDSGRVPRTIECEVVNDLVDRVIPGDVVEITGIVKVSQSEKNYSRVKTGNTMYLLYIDVNYLIKSTMTLEDDDMLNEFDSKDSPKDSKDSIQITTKDLYAIEEVHMEPQLFKLIVNSFSPAIFGHEMVKAGILFALFGGRRRSNSAIDRTTTRSDPHVLVVGDPGLGKSQMLTAAVKVAPRGVYVCGSSGISTSGLTVTLVRGSGSDFALEAGALVLADQGCCCIDEFDKMTTDHNALLEAMEQQSISIAKAGIICTLPARTSVIAAANPVGGHYNMSKTVAENLKMNTALLSRFDLIFILMDKPDGEMDQYLSRHVMALHSGNPSSSPAFRGSMSQENSFGQTPLSQSNRVKPEMDRPLSERLRMTDDDQLELIPLPLLRKYIAYARQYVHPRLSPEAAATLQDFYLLLRARHRSPDGTPVTTRQLESLIRMSEAKARMELREVVTRRDAMDVIEIIYVAELNRISHATSNNMFSQDQLYHFLLTVPTHFFNTITSRFDIMASSKKIVLVTGCTTGGIGYETAKAFEKNGCKVYAAARRLEAITGIEGLNIEKVYIDVLDEKSIKDAVNIETTRKLLDTNITSVILVSKEVAPHMIRQKSGLIVNVGSVTAYLSTPWGGLYSASKAAVHSISDALRMELAPFGVNVSIVAPGAIKSNIGDNNLKAFHLPEKSFYQSVISYIMSRANASQAPGCTPTASFAKYIVAKCLKSSPPRYIDYGTLSSLFRFLRYAPWMITDFIFSRKFGLNVLQKLVKDGKVVGK